MTVASDSPASSTLVALEEIEAAHGRIRNFVHRTPLLTSTTLDRIATDAISSYQKQQGLQSPPIQVRLAFKAEHLQRVGAFKMRGATNAVQTHLEQLRKQNASFDASKLWLVTHSSGNHAAAIACAAQSVGAKAAVVMPRTAPAIKKAAVATYGARIVECEPNQQAREHTAQAVRNDLQKDGQIVKFIHPYDEPMVIAGQGTLGLEMLEQANALQHHGTWSLRANAPHLDLVVAPVGGGGMLSGVSTAVTQTDTRVKVYAAEPKEADDAARSLESSQLQPAINPPRTICDGLLTALSPRTFQHIQAHVQGICTVGEEDIVHAMRLVWERMKQMIEPSAAVGLAAVLNNSTLAQAVCGVAEALHGQHSVSDGKPVEVRIGIVWTGGNVDLGAISKLFAK